jgi:predicted peptidase
MVLVSDFRAIILKSTGIRDVRCIQLFGLKLVLCIAVPLPAQEPQEQSIREPGRQVPSSFELSDGAKMEYLVYAPKDFEAGGAKKFPLMLFLHGRGESRGGIQRVAAWGPPQMVARGEHLPFVIVSPQCPPEDWWSSEKQQNYLTEFLDYYTSMPEIDGDRIYLTGLSMGGYGSWALAARHPDRFAAVVPICGAGEVKNAEQLKNLPIWVFHGDQDFVIPIEKSTEMVESIRAAGSTKIRFITLEHIGHNSWSAAYGTPELYEWMLRQKRKAALTETE